MRTPLKILIFSSIGISLLAGLIPQLRGLLTLSWVGVEHYYLWQFVSYIFVERGPISLNFAISLAFNMYILWVFGMPLLERAGAKLFFTLYFGGAIFGGVSALLFPGFVLAGSTNAIFPLLVSWMMLNPNSQLLLFFTVPFKSYVLVLALLGISLFIDLANADWVGAVSLLISCLYAYLFTMIIWKEGSPLAILRPLERKILQFFERRKKPKKVEPKIYDIQSGKPISDDDQFMDAMLDRISRHGEDSLTPAEKKRMREISKRRKK